MSAASLTQFQRTGGIWFFSLLAAVFGLLTIKSGGAVLFFDGPARQAAGHYVPFVLWFNFLAGFVYVLTGWFLWSMNPVSVRLSVFLFLSTLMIYGGFGVYIFIDGDYEMRTVLAMLLRTLVWATISAYSWRFFNRS